MKIFKFKSSKVNLFLLSIVVSIFLFVLGYASVKAWNAPTVASLCAPDESHFSFKVTLAAESNYNTEWSFDPGFAGATSITLSLGDNIVPSVPRGSHVSGDAWYIRFASDHGVIGSANADGTLCNTPTPTNTPTNTPTATPTATPVPTPLTCTGDQHLDGGGVNCVSFSQAGPPPQGPYTPPQGQVLGTSTMAGTGSFAENLYIAIMGLGGLITAFGFKNFKKAN